MSLSLSQMHWNNSRFSGCELKPKVEQEFPLHVAHSTLAQERGAKRGWIWVEKEVENTLRSAFWTLEVSCGFQRGVQTWLFPLLLRCQSALVQQPHLPHLHRFPLLPAAENKPTTDFGRLVYWSINLSLVNYLLRPRKGHKKYKNK